MVLSSFPANLDWIHLCRYLISHALFFNLVLSVNDTPENAVRLKTERSQLHRLTRRIEESVWLPRSGKSLYISGSTIQQIN